MFHEFGHALHGLSSNVTYPTLSGTNVARDYVEFPSQLLEHWLSTPEVLQKYAVHYQTGKPIPQALVDKIKKAATFNQGFATTEYLSSALRRHEDASWFQMARSMWIPSRSRRWLRWECRMRS